MSRKPPTDLCSKRTRSSISEMTAFLHPSRFKLRTLSRQSVSRSRNLPYWMDIYVSQRKRRLRLSYPETRRRTRRPTLSSPSHIPSTPQCHLDVNSSKRRLLSLPTLSLRLKSYLSPLPHLQRPHLSFLLPSPLPGLSTWPP